MKNAFGWTDTTANRAAHFVEVMNYLSRSEWIKSKAHLTKTSDANGNPVETVEHPDIYTVNSILVLARQLHLAQDSIFEKAVEDYKQHCDHELRPAWVGLQLDQFNKLYNSPCFIFTPELTNKQLLSHFLYGFGLIHRNEEKDTAKFRTLFEKHGRGTLLMQFQMTMRSLIVFPNNASIVMSQDYNHWIEQGAAKPTRVSIKELMGPPIA